MIKTEFLTLLDFDDLLIQPCCLSNIRSRKEINIKDENGFLPLMTAPMDTVICDDNIEIFKNNGIIPVIPRGKKDIPTFLNPDTFMSYSLEEFENVFLSEKSFGFTHEKVYALIDIANGHMNDLFQLAKKAKKVYEDRLVLMVGNIANPDTFLAYCDINVDLIRIGIGNGNVCTTTVHTGVGYPMASLIDECFKIREYGKFKPKIVADGGMKKYSDIIKALALGSDFVMIGSIFNKALESAGTTLHRSSDGEIVDQYSKNTKIMFECGIPLFKKYRGMSTKQVQRQWGKDEIKTSEGVERINKVEYTLDGWVNNFESYLKSAMSYCGKYDIKTFIGNVTLNTISNNSFKRFDK
jgi:GMP reductase